MSPFILQLPTLAAGGFTRERASNQDHASQSHSGSCSYDCRISGCHPNCAGWNIMHAAQLLLQRAHQLSPYTRLKTTAALCLGQSGR